MGGKLSLHGRKTFLTRADNFPYMYGKISAHVKN